MTQSFGDFIRAKQKQEAHRAPASRAAYESQVYILRIGADGKLEDRPAAPAFMRKDPKALVAKHILPKDYYWKNSQEYRSRKAELESGKGA